MKFSQIWNEKSKLIKKLWLNQFAFSLFGLFVATPFSGNICVLAGIFAVLFYLSVCSYMIIDDAQKDNIKHKAGRGESLHKNVGLMYCIFAYLPSLILVGGYTVYTFIATELSGILYTVYFLITKYVLCGEMLGIDIGLTKYTYDSVNHIRLSDASETVLFLSNHGIFQLAFCIIAPVILAILYRLAFVGVISFNTTDTKKKK